MTVASCFHESMGQNDSRSCKPRDSGLNKNGDKFTTELPVPGIEFIFSQKLSLHGHFFPHIVSVANCAATKYNCRGWPSTANSCLCSLGPTALQCLITLPSNDGSRCWCHGSTATYARKFERDKKVAVEIPSFLLPFFFFLVSSRPCPCHHRDFGRWQRYHP